jgi:hypothetical protein
MIDFDHADIERLWNSIIHYVPERQRFDLLKSLEDIGVDHEVLKGSAELDPKLEEAVNTVFEEDESEDVGYGDTDE